MLMAIAMVFKRLGDNGWTLTWTVTYMKLHRIPSVVYFLPIAYFL